MTDSPTDLERRAVEAYVDGRYDESVKFWARAYERWVEEAVLGRAVRCAFWLAMGLQDRGEGAQANGWLGRAARLAGRQPDATAASIAGDAMVRGYLLGPMAVQRMFDRPDLAYPMFEDVAEVAETIADGDLGALAALGRGSCLIRIGRGAEGMAVLDELLVVVVSAPLLPMVAGLVYCAVIEICRATFDTQRAREWTVALDRWCMERPGLMGFRGRCHIHRAEVMQLHGAWSEAQAESEDASTRFPEGHPAAGGAQYLQAQLARLRGDLVAAEDAYGRASLQGTVVQPGLALLRLAQGNVEAADSGLRRALAEPSDPLFRPQLLAGFVDVALVAGDVPAARSSADELTTLATAVAVPYLEAVAAFATGQVLLAEGEPAAALGPLRRAWSRWRELGAPYDAGRARMSIGLACRALGDEDSALMELEAVGWVFEQLGAAPDLARARELMGVAETANPTGLTAREVEVLTLVARGKTNRAIAGELFVSEKTVARHVSNILGKLDVRTRGAASAYAYEHELI